MGVENILAIVSALLPIIEAKLTGAPKEGVDVAENLLQIIRASQKEYQDHTGQPIDPNLLQPINKVE